MALLSGKMCTEEFPKELHVVKTPASDVFGIILACNLDPPEFAVIPAAVVRQAFSALLDGVTRLDVEAYTGEA